MLHGAIVKNKEAVLINNRTKAIIGDPFTKPLMGEGFHLPIVVVMGWLTCCKLEAIINTKNKGVCIEK